MHISNIKSGEHIFLEIVSRDYMRVFKEEEYEMYLKEDLILYSDERSESEKEEYIDKIFELLYKEV